MIEKQRSLQTKKQLDEAFLRLYTKKSYLRITVNEICKEAELHRTTFYLHYESIDQMLRDIEEALIKQLEKITMAFCNYDLINTKNNQSLYIEMYNNLIKFALDNKGSLIPLKNDSYFVNKVKNMYIDEMCTYLKLMNVPISVIQDYILDYMASGASEMIYKFLKNQDIEADDLRDILMTLVNKNPFFERT